VAQQLWYVAQIRGININGCEGSACNVELISQPHVYVGDFHVSCLVAGPGGEGFEELLRGKEELGHASLNLGEWRVTLRGLAAL
jgi:hypothetical protein